MVSFRFSGGEEVREAGQGPHYVGYIDHRRVFQEVVGCGRELGFITTLLVY